MVEYARTQSEVTNVSVFLALLVSIVRSISMNVKLPSALWTQNVLMALGHISACAKQATQVCCCLNTCPTGFQVASSSFKWHFDVDGTNYVVRLKIGTSKKHIVIIILYIQQMHTLYYVKHFTGLIQYVAKLQVYCLCWIYDFIDIKSYTQYTQYTCNLATYYIRPYMYSIYNSVTMLNVWGALMMIPLDRNMLANLWSVLHNKECAFVGCIELLLWKCSEEHIQK
jgi:hypothetical protein